MAEKKIEKKIATECCVHHNPILLGFKLGLGFWLAGLAIWLIVSVIVAGLYYIL